MNGRNVFPEFGNWKNSGLEGIGNCSSNVVHFMRKEMFHGQDRNDSRPCRTRIETCG